MYLVVSGCDFYKPPNTKCAAFDEKLRLDIRQKAVAVVREGKKSSSRFQCNGEAVTGLLFGDVRRDSGRN